MREIKRFNDFFENNNERIKFFIKNLPEPLKTKLRQLMVDDQNFKNELYKLINLLFDKLNSNFKIENFFIHLRYYNQTEPTNILKIIDDYLDR